MIAQYIMEKLESVDHLTHGAKYEVLDMETKKSKLGEVAKIKIKNDEGKVNWYAAEKFLFYAIGIDNGAAAGAGQNAAQSVTETPEEIRKEILRECTMTTEATRRTTAEEARAMVDVLETFKEAATREAIRNFMHYGAQGAGMSEEQRAEIESFIKHGVTLTGKQAQAIAAAILETHDLQEKTLKEIAEIRERTEKPCMET